MWTIWLAFIKFFFFWNYTNISHSLLFLPSLHKKKHATRQHMIPNQTKKKGRKIYHSSCFCYASTLEFHIQHISEWLEHIRCSLDYKSRSLVCFKFSPSSYLLHNGQICWLSLGRYKSFVSTIVNTERDYLYSHCVILI